MPRGFAAKLLPCKVAGRPSKMCLGARSWPQANERPKEAASLLPSLQLRPQMRLAAVTIRYKTNKLTLSLLLFQAHHPRPDNH